MIEAGQYTDIIILDDLESCCPATEEPLQNLKHNSLTGTENEAAILTTSFLPSGGRPERLAVTSQFTLAEQTLSVTFI